MGDILGHLESIEEQLGEVIIKFGDKMSMRRPKKVGRSSTTPTCTHHTTYVLGIIALLNALNRDIRD